MLAGVTTGYDSLRDADGLLWFEILYMDYQLEYKLSTFPSCKWIVTATAEYWVTYCAGPIKYTDTQSSHNKLLLEWKYQGSFLVTKDQSISETESQENLELSQNKAQNESATWC